VPLLLAGMSNGMLSWVSAASSGDLAAAFHACVCLVEPDEMSLPYHCSQAAQSNRSRLPDPDLRPLM